MIMLRLFGANRFPLAAATVAGLTAFAFPAAAQKPLPAAKVERVSAVAPEPATAAPALRMQGDALFGVNNKDGAVRAYTQAALADPQNSTTRLCLGVSLAAVRRQDLALFQFRKAVDLAPDEILPALLLQNALQERGSGAEAQDLYLDIAQKFARKDSKPGLDASQSISRLQASVRQFPKSPILHLLLGDAYQLAENWAEADKAYTIARLLAPHWAKPCVNLGLSRLAQNKPNEAIHIFETALVLEPGSVQAQLWKGNAELKAGKDEAAVRSFSRATVGRAARTTPGVAVQAATGMGQAFARSGSYEKAIVQLQRAEKIAPADPVPPALIGEVHVQNGDFVQAASAYSTALRLTRNGGLFSNRPVLYRGLVEAQLCAHKPDDALVSLTRALIDEPESAALWHRLRAQAYFDQNENKEAQQELRAALDSTPLGEYPLDTLNAIAARNLMGVMKSDYEADYRTASSGIRRTTLPGGSIALVSPSARAKTNDSGEASAKVRALLALASLARYRSDITEEIRLRGELTQLRVVGIDWLLLGDAYDSRAGQPANARGAYSRAVEIGGLPAPAVERVRERLIRLNAPLYKP